MAAAPPRSHAGHAKEGDLASQRSWIVSIVSGSAVETHSEWFLRMVVNSDDALLVVRCRGPSPSWGRRDSAETAPSTWLPDAFQACSSCTRISALEVDGESDLLSFMRREGPAHTALALISESVSTVPTAEFMPTLLIRGELSVTFPRHIVILIDGDAAQRGQGTSCLPLVAWTASHLARHGDEIYLAHASASTDDPATLATMAAINFSRTHLIGAGHRASCVHPMLITCNTLTGALTGDVRDAILDVLQSQQPLPFTMAVCGTAKATGLRRMLLGSVAHHLMAHAPLPVLLVPPTVLSVGADKPESISDP